MTDRTICMSMALLLAANSFGAVQAADEISAQHDAPMRNPAPFHHAPLGPLQFSYEILATPVIGQTIEVKIVVSPALPFTVLTTEVYAHDGLIVTTPRFSVTEPGVGEPVEHTLAVTPYVEGSLRLFVLALGEIEGESQAGQLTVPLQVGPRSQDPDPIKKKTAPDGESIISLRALEN